MRLSEKEALKLAKKITGLEGHNVSSIANKRINQIISRLYLDNHQIQTKRLLNLWENNSIKNLRRIEKIYQDIKSGKMNIGRYIKDSEMKKDFLKYRKELKNRGTISPKILRGFFNRIQNEEFYKQNTELIKLYHYQRKNSDMLTYTRTKDKLDEEWEELKKLFDNM